MKSRVRIPKVLDVKAEEGRLDISYYRDGARNKFLCHCYLHYRHFVKLKDASLKDIKGFRLSRNKENIHWDKLDEDIHLINFIEACDP